MNEKASKALLVGGALGAGMLAMYLFDPARGSLRRELIATAVGQFARRGTDRVRGTASHLYSRAGDYMPSTASHHRAMDTMEDMLPASTRSGSSLGRYLGLAAAVASSYMLYRSLSASRGTHMEKNTVQIDQDLYIAASPERIFQFWRQQDNLPQFMRHVKEVTPAGVDLWHWKVSGPLGSSVEWDSRITEEIENRVLAWESVPGAEVDNRGRIEFEPEGAGTRVHVTMQYCPPGGALGHIFASLFGKDAKTEMEEDLMRIKESLESGAGTASTWTGGAKATQTQSLH